MALLSRIFAGWTLALAVAGAQEIQIAAPASVMAGDVVTLRVTRDGRPVENARVRILGPGERKGRVNASTLNLREGPSTDAAVRGVIYRGDTVLVTSEEGAWCGVIVSSGRAGYAACEFLEVTPFGQPLGITDADGRVVTLELALVPAVYEAAVVIGEEIAARAQVTVAQYVYDYANPIAEGVSYRERRFFRGDDGPFTMQILEVDPRQPQVFVLPVRANDRAITKERTSSMSRRYGATAAVNLGYFVVTTSATGWAGQSAGAYMYNGEVIAAGSGRTAMLLCAPGSAARAELDTVSFTGSVTPAGGPPQALAGLNRARPANGVVAYRPVFGETTQTPEGGVDLTLDAAGRVMAQESGNAAIPADGMVVSAAGNAAALLRERATPGSLLQVSAALATASPPEALGGCRPTDILGAGPRLVANGQVDVSAESFGHENARNPRTVFAITGRGTWLFATLDGRQASSVGMTLPELAEELVSLGAVRAMNYDGGGSSTLVVGGAIRNSPSDGPEREVSDGLLIYSVAELADLGRILDSLLLDEKQIQPGAASLFTERYQAASAALLEGELEVLRNQLIALREDAAKLKGREVSIPAARLLDAAVNGYLAILPGLQGASRRKR